VVALNEEEALKKAKEIDPSITADQLKSDEDALDTWFSSWLWPISLFDGINNPGNEEINYYYPTAVLVTGPDIIFFWVARMIMSGCEYQKQIPFRNVYFTGIVRDKLGRKMSKSLGNSPDPLELIEKFGADGVRMGMMLAAPAGNDILYDDALSAQGMNFCNKMWNAFRLVKGWEVSNEAASESNKKAIEWMNAKIRSAYAEINDDYDKYRLNEALMAAFKLFTDEFSGWYLEMIKPAYQCPIDKETLEATLDIFDKLLHIIHPFMPFITEELWQHIADRKDGEALMLDVFKLDAPTEADEKIMAQFEEAKQIISGVRGVRQSKNIGPREPLTLEVVASADEKVITKCPAIGPIIKKMAGLEGISYVEQKGEGSSAFMIGTREYAVPLGNLIDVEAELEKAEAQLKHLQGFLMGVRKKLSNERFVANAPEAVVALERKKESDSLEKIAALEQTIAELKKNS
jgi:valyl-tRNA synthetase